MSAAPARARVFLALRVEARLAERLAAAVAGVLPAADFRRTRAEDLHLTVCFLGELEPAPLARARAELPGTLSGARRPRLVLAAAGAFPAPARARVLVCHVRAAEPARLEGLVRALAVALRAAGLDPERHAHATFRPHVTVARPRRRAQQAPAAFLALAPEGAWEPEALELLESRPGVPYRTLAVFPLSDEA